MKKIYTSPTVEIEKFTVTNILTVSGLGGTDTEVPGPRSAYEYEF